MLRLRKSLYGLKQAGRLWIQLLHSKLCEAGYKQSQVDGCMYFKRQDKGIIVLGVNVDDLLGAATSEELLSKVGNELASVSVKCLGTRVMHSQDLSLSLDQEPLIDEVLSQFGLVEANAVRSPMETGTREDNTR